MEQLKIFAKVIFAKVILVLKMEISLMKRLQFTKIKGKYMVTNCIFLAHENLSKIGCCRTPSS